jgi:hypothetical protein
MPPLPLLLLLLAPLVNMLLVTGMNPSTVMHAAITKMNMRASVTCKHRLNMATAATPNKVGLLCDRTTALRLQST